ncbi:Hint domain-containing protein [Rhizosaccharibacter radicis]|uniref:Hint domain-containing protein n=1 Tax=Rhizosaccharibacter radicis TaxID=2782605 RepID=A0ABT1VYW6_9PROT|nr:Hint domain-containing protein [Acetobacteraceae bacterium KSS12]
MSLNLLYNQVLDYSVNQTLNLNVGGNILITRDAQTPAGDPVVVNLSDLADAQALNQIVISNGATGVVAGGLASLKALSGITVDGGVLELNTNIANINALNSISVGPDGGTIKVDSSTLGVGVLSVPVGFVDSNGQPTTTPPPGFAVDFPQASTISAYYDAALNQTTIGQDINLGVINISTGPSLVVRGNPFGLNPNGALTTYTNITNSDGNGGILVCFLEDSMILTADGPVPVQDLRLGDSVVTFRNGIEERSPLVWIGRTHAVADPALPDDLAGYPVRILAGAIEDGVPFKDMLVTPEHCLFLDGRFVPVRMLVNERSIFYDRSIRSYHSYHIETDRHSVIMADGVLTESYLDTGNRATFRQVGTVVGLRQAGGRSWTADAAALLGVDRAFVEPVFDRIAGRAERAGHPRRAPAPEITSETGLHLVTDDGRELLPVDREGDRFSFVLPETATTIRIRSNSSRPSDVVGPFLDDRRRLGVLIGEVSLRIGPDTIALDAHLGQDALDGWHGPEGGRCRWTDGNALLPLGDRAPSGPGTLVIQILSAGPYRRADQRAADAPSEWAKIA